MNGITEFDPAGPLPEGRIVLEASAGTGKTWTIAALTTRYVAEAGLPVEDILVVTFTRAATSELRARVRQRLADAARFLASGQSPARTDDPILAHLADTGDTERALRAGRLRRAVADFDRATITTLHGFASRLLTELGFLSASLPTFEVSADRGDLTDDVIAEMIIDRYADGSEDPPRLSDLEEIAGAVLLNHDADIVPDEGAVDGIARVRSTFATDLRALVAERSTEAGIVTYDDLLVLARDALKEPSVADLTADLIGGRYRVALVDEFQDTDRVQWEIVDGLFAGSGSTLVIIGDPKQSIYAFRGADVAAYLAAADVSRESHTLSVNWRSDGPLLSALDAVFDGLAFGDPRIPYRRVAPAPGRSASAVRGVDAPVALRMVGRDAPVRQNRDQTLSVPAARRFIADDVAATVVGFLTRPAEIEVDGAWRAVRPGDIAVLCRTGTEVLSVSTALRSRSVPSVSGRAGSVLTSDAAGHWLTLLAALEFPSSNSRARAAALTPMLGWTVERLRDAIDEDLLELHERISDWSHLVATLGVAALWKEIERCTEVTSRVLSDVGGERLATDLDHLSELLHAAGRTGARPLRDWLLTEVERAEGEQGDSDVRARRLETDADAVQVVTIHGAKGLEFPIVLAPFLWNVSTSSPEVPVFHPEGSRRRAVDVGGRGNWDGFGDSAARAVAEAAAEEMRLMYVAMTRARHHLAVWWAICSSAQRAPLSRVLFGRVPGDPEPREKVALVSDDRLARHLRPILEAAAGNIAFSRVTAEPDPTPWQRAEPPAPTLSVAGFARPIDHRWRRSSFTGITASAAHPHPGADPDALAILDEPRPVDTEADTAPTGPGELPMGEMVGGVRFGTLVHTILERVEFSADDLDDRLAAATTEEVSRRGLDVNASELADALAGVIKTPLVATEGRPRLADIGPADRLAELEFEMPVASASSDVGTGDIAAVLESHLDPGHRLAGYADRLRRMGGARFRGHMTGAIDLVTRIGDPPAYWVIDHKTNQLHPRGETPAIGHYAPAAMARAMTDGDYVLQSSIYQVALHRYLRLRIPDYDIGTHLGGSMYLFVRGMIGERTPVSDGGRHGVFTWPADPGLILELDRLFEAGRDT